MGKIGDDERWEAMFPFAEYLEKTFPRIHKDGDIEREVVNTHGLLYTWKGSESGLKPLLLMAHQDVVPVPDATLDQWTYPPFSGHYDGTSIWGRGSSDCKNQLIAVMETIELLLSAGFEPKRTIILSFGFDEEISGRQGAGHLAKVLDERYGKDGIAAIVDEGSGIQEAWGTIFAQPGTGEKGYTDVHVVIRTKGGHSSIPTDHTGIGILSELITKIESTQYPTYLTDSNPYLGALQCGAAHAPHFPNKLKKLLSGRDESKICKHNDLLALEAAKQGRPVQYLMQTSQAVDIIAGGVKVNALPERVSATVNHRITQGDEPEMVWSHLTDLAGCVAKKHNLTLRAFEENVTESENSIILSAEPTTLLTAPTTPTDVDRETPYRILAGTTRAVYGSDIVVSPGSMTGNTDTRFYWNLTRHIFRYGPGFDPEAPKGLANIHTVDEHISVRNHVGMVKWFGMFVRNMDEVELEN